MLERLESHFARPCVKARVVAALDIAPSLYSQVVQHVIARVFPECCDLDLEAAEEGRKLTGLIPRGGVCRVAPAHLERFAASLA